MFKCILISLLANVALVSCSKEWLDERSSKQLTVPSTLKDAQALLDNTNLFNGMGDAMHIQSIAEIQGDDFVMNDFALQTFEPALPEYARAYRFDKDIFVDQTNIAQWNIPYRRIFIANVALETLQNLEADDHAQQLSGEAFFHRAHSYFWLAQLFIAPYNPSTSADQLGLPLRLSADPNTKSTRSTLQQTYDAIISDLRQALALLPPTSEGLRPTKAAASALFSRTWLSMGNFDSCLVYAEKALLMNDELVDFNSLDAMADFPVPQYNQEVIFSDIAYSSILHPFFCEVSEELLSLYSSNDLRSTIFFKIKADGKSSFNGGYDGSFAQFCGISANELYLMKAECMARLGNEDGAREMLDKLLQKRFVTNAHTPVAETGENLLQTILLERRKELCFRGLRWMDIRRLNESNATIDVRHVLNLEEFILPARDARFVFPIPPDVLKLSGMQQNER